MVISFQNKYMVPTDKCKIWRLLRRARYNDWSRALRSRGRSSGSDRVKNFHFSISSILA
jgi:hypothetical protein